MEYTVRQLKAEIADVAAFLGKEVPAGMSKLRKADLEQVLATLREAAQAKRAREATDAGMKATLDQLAPVPAADDDTRDLDALAEWEAELLAPNPHQVVVEPTGVPADIRAVTDRYKGLEVTRSFDEVRVGTKGSIETMQALQAELEALPTVLRVEHTDDDAFAVYAILRTDVTQARDDLAWIDTLPTEPAVFPGDHRDGCECEDCEAFYADEHTSVPAPDGLGQRDGEVDPEFAAEVDRLIAADLAADAVPAELVERVQFASTLPITATNIEQAQVAVVVQSGSRLLWGTLISVVNRRTRYSSPLLVTVEVDGHRQLVAADDVLAA